MNRDSDQSGEKPTALNGVNLGGWIIPERWMTPDLFKGCDGDDAASLIEPTGGADRYEQHIREFITEEDFKWMNRQGITFIRLPVAWWMFRSAPRSYEAAGLTRVDWAMKMAEKYNMAVLLDFHAARGSQNGKDHSGKIGQIEWKAYKKQNIAYVEALAMRYKNEPALWGIELLNEPVLHSNLLALLSFYRKTSKRLRAILPKSIRIVYHDSFHPYLAALFPLRGTLDMHLYEIPARPKDTLQSYMSRRDKRYRRFIRAVQMIRPVIVGEWSGVLPMELRESVRKDEVRQMIRTNIVTQQQLYSSTSAHAFWSYKANNMIMWSARTTKR